MLRFPSNTLQSITKLKMETSIYAQREVRSVKESKFKQTILGRENKQIHLEIVVGPY